MILKSKAKEAEIEDVSPHDLQRTFIRSRFEAGNDIMFVAVLGGYVSLSTTRQYDTIGEKGKKAAKSLALFSRAARRN